MLRKILDPSNSLAVFVTSLAVMYFLIPLYAYNFDNGDPYNLKISTMCAVSCAMLMVGFTIPVLDNFSLGSGMKFKFNQMFFSRLIVVLFTLFLVITVSTAESIPIFSAFKGANANELSAQRGALFKGRGGWAVILLYLFSFFSQAMMPYAIADQFIRGDRWRYYSLGIFFIFTIISLQKLLFVSALIPFVYAMTTRGREGRRVLLATTLTFPLILFLLTRLSLGEDVVSSVSSGFGSLFSADYQPSGTIDTLVWRTFAVPVFTATDTLHVFYEKLGGANLYGATSNLISALAGINRVNLERIVFEYQWGWNDIANANCVYFVDAFVNFGWAGLCIISIIVGQSLRWFRNSDDLAIKSLWPLYCLGLFNATSIAMLFSNGYLLIWIMLLFTSPRVPAVRVPKLTVDGGGPAGLDCSAA